MRSTSLPLMVDIEQAAVCSYSPSGFVDFMTTNGQYIWITNPDENVVQCFNHLQAAPIYATPVAKAAGVPVYAFASIWVASLSEQAIYRIHPETGTILAVIETGLGDLTGEFSLAASPQGVWVVCANGKLCMIDPVQAKVTTTLTVAPDSYNLTYGDGALWLSNQSQDSVQRIDVHHLDTQQYIAVGKKPVFLAYAEQAVFTLNQSDGTVSKIDTLLNTCVTTVQLPEQAKGDGGDITVSHGKVWVRTTHILLIQLDAKSLQIEKIYSHDIAAGSGAVCAQNNLLWISAHDIDKLWAIDLES